MELPWCSFKGLQTVALASNHGSNRYLAGIALWLAVL